MHRLGHSCSIFSIYCDLSINAKLVLSFSIDTNMWNSFVLILSVSIGTRKEKTTYDAYESHGST